MRFQSHEDRAAFTLVELLVVIGIIGVLIAILLPALAKARANAQMTACKSNLQQIALATKMYANDYKDRYPDGYTLGGWSYRRAVDEKMTGASNALPEVYGLNAVLNQRKYLSGRSEVWICPSATDLMKEYRCTYSFNAAIDYNKIRTSGGEKVLDPDMQNWRDQKRRGKYKQSAWWVNDNIQYKPWATGFRKGVSENSTGMLLAGTEVVYPHNYRTRLKSGQPGRTGSINVLFGDGAVGIVKFTEIGTTLSDPEVIRGE